MERRPLPEQFTVRTRIEQLVSGDTSEVVAGDIADAIAAGLDRVHLDARQLGENVWHVFEARPIELDVLPRSEVAVASVILPADMRERAQLGRRQKSVRDGDAQHRRIA